jgi:hypothetical protein
MKRVVVESREQVEPKDETEPVEDLEVDAEQAENVAGGFGGGSAPTGAPGIQGGGGAPTQGPPR